MSYTIYKEWTVEEVIDGNLTTQAIRNDEDFAALLYNDYTGSTAEDVEDLEDVDARALDDFWQYVEDSYHPLYNWSHVLADKPTDDDLIKIIENAPNITIMRDESDNHFITLNGCGMDYSDSIAYAYLIIDRRIPCGLLREGEYHTVSKEGAEALKAHLKAQK